MRAHWWSWCLLGLMCMPAEGRLNKWTVSQSPLSIPKRVNSTAAITCSTSFTKPLGLELYRRFHGDRIVMYLGLADRKVSHKTLAREFEGRLHVALEPQMKVGFGFTFRLSLLGPDDTDVYYCTWTHFNSETNERESQSSNGTVIIVTDTDPQEQCKSQKLDFVLIFMSVLALIVVLLLLTGALISRCKRFKRHFRPNRAVKPPRVSCPQHVGHQHRIQLNPYLVTSVDTQEV